MGQHFLSYSTRDGLLFATQLVEGLRHEGFDIWMDKFSLRPGSDWDDQICGAIRLADCVIFAMTSDSVSPASPCKHEIVHSLRYKKPVVPLLVHAAAIPPLLLNTRQYINFADGDYENSFRRLVDHLCWLRSPQGIAQSLEERRRDAERDSRYSAVPSAAARASEEAALLAQRIQEMKTAPRDDERPKPGTFHTSDQTSVPAMTFATRIVHAPPCQVPQFFQDRFIETELAAKFLSDDTRCVMAIVGRGGVGKTSMVVRLLKSIEKQRTFDKHILCLDGIIYYPQHDLAHFSCRRFWQDLLTFVARSEAAKLERIIGEGTLDPGTGTSLVLDSLGNQRVVVVFDNIPEIPTEIADFVPILDGILHHTTSPIKVVYTSRMLNRELAINMPQRQLHIHLDQGLPSPYAEQLLRQMDADGTLGLRDAPAAILEEARRRTNGFPRALEALYAILSVDRHADLRGVLYESNRLLPEDVVECLVGEAYSRLDQLEQMAMQTLAVYAIPVGLEAVSIVLKTAHLNISAGPVVKRLVNLHLVRKEGSRYYLHEADQQYARGRLPDPSQARIADEPSEWNSQHIIRIATQYLASVVATSEDHSQYGLQCAIREVELLGELGQHDIAAKKLLELDEEFLFHSGSYALLARLYEGLISRFNNVDPMDQCRSRLAFVYRRLGRYGEAEVLYRRILSSLSLDFMVPDHIQCFGGLANCARNLARLDAAEMWYRKAIAAAEALEAPRASAEWLGGLGNCQIERGDIDAAIITLLQAIEAFRALCDETGEASRLYALARAYVLKGLPAAAETAARKAAMIARRLNLCRSGNMANLWLAVSCLQQDKSISARYAITAAEEYPEPTSTPLLHLISAFVCLSEGLCNQANDRFRMAVDSAQSLLRWNPANALATDVIEIVASLQKGEQPKRQERPCGDRAFIGVLAKLGWELIATHLPDEHANDLTPASE